MTHDINGFPERDSRAGAPLEAALGQKRLWFVAQLYPQTPAYNEPIMLQCAEVLDAPALTAALSAITARHTSWRTVFVSSQGQVYLRVLPPVPFSLPVVDLENLPVEQRAAEALRLATAAAREPFDLSAGPLVRGVLVRLGEHDQRLFITAHHLVVDGLSYFQVFVPELHALYNACRSGQPSVLPALPLQYSDFANWQRHWLTEERLAPQLAYWEKQLAHLPPRGVELVTDFPRTEQPTHPGARQEVVLSAALTEALRTLSRRVGVSLFTVVLAAWETLLFRSSGQSDIVVGTAVSGRRQPEFEPLIGFFSNNLVLRTRLASNLTFEQLLGQTSEVLQQARAHQDVPFERLVTHLGVPRTLNQNPLFNTTCIVMPKVPLPSSPPHFTVSRFDIGTAKLDLYLELHQHPTGLAGHLEYRTDLFRAETIARLVGHLQTLLTAVAADPTQPLGQLGMLTPKEQRELEVFTGHSRLASPSPERCPLPQLFEQQVARTPDAVAVEFQEQRLTYRQLNARANQLAHFLRELGVGPEILVGLLLERGPEMVVGILAIHKAGGAYVPLDPDQPAERLRFFLDDTKLPILISRAETRDLALPSSVSRRICLDADGPAIARHAQTNLPPLATLNHLAYVIYTSGSTGRPKGVQIEHGGFANLAVAEEARFGSGPGSRVLLFWSFSSDGSAWDLAMTLTTGATLVLATRAALLPGPELASFLRTQAISIVVLPPSALAVLPVENLPALRRLVVGAEACPPELVARWAGQRHFYNAYGPTEATVVTTIAQCSDSLLAPPIGRPIAGTQCYVLDDALQQVAIGTPGELYIGGSGLARGYLNRPELTAERFLSLPIPGQGSPRLYRTGDRVCWRPDGNLEFLGRVDRQVKLRGFRIELGEIESLLLRHRELREAAVLLREDHPGDKRLVAYVVPRQAESPELRAAVSHWLKEQLPAYMIPASLVVLPELPKSAAGKIDYRALPPPSALAGPTPDAHPAPLSAIAQVIIAAWKQVLHCEAIGGSDNFFDLGGHSLRLAEVQSLLQTALGRAVPMLDLFRYPTVRELAQHLGSAPGAAAASTLPDSEVTSSQDRAEQQRTRFAQLRRGSRRKPSHE